MEKDPTFLELLTRLRKAKRPLARASSLYVDTGERRMANERGGLVGKSKGVYDEMRMDAAGRTPTVGDLSWDADNGQYFGHAPFSGDRLDKPSILIGRNAESAAQRILEEGDSARDQYNIPPESGFVLAHEYGHHLKSGEPFTDSEYPFGNAEKVRVSNRSNDSWGLANQIDADLTGYVMSENAGSDVSLKDSTTTVDGVSLLKLLAKRRAYLEANKRTFAPPAYKKWNNGS
tara:strand:+ start:31676 stop:32371 length:696 start_codon:yes stop_codon:yes gene_type:complete